MKKIEMDRSKRKINWKWFLKWKEWCLEFDGNELKLEDYGLVFQNSRLSRVYGYNGMNLKQNGDNISVTIDNAEEYIDSILKYVLKDGIYKQI